MTLDPNTLVPLGAAVPVALWLGKRIKEQTAASVNLSRDIKELRKTIQDLSNEKLSQSDFVRYMERLGYKNPTLQMPEHREDAA